MEHLTNKNFVLVHGAWHGSWCWERFSPLLEAEGAKVFAPCLAAVGERVSEDASEVSLQFCINDLIQQIKQHYGDAPIILVGHSFSGAVVAAAADILYDQLEQLIILDGCFLNSFQSLYSIMDPEIVQLRKRQALELGDDRFPPPKVEAFGISDPNDKQWIEERLTTHPLHTYSKPVPERTHSLADVPTQFIYFVNPPFPTISPFYEQAKALGWPTHVMEVPHDAMVTHPKELAETMIRLIQNPVAKHR